MENEDVERDYKSSYCFYDHYPPIKYISAFDSIKMLIYVLYVIIYLRYILIDRAFSRIHKVLYSFPILMFINVMGTLWVVNTDVDKKIVWITQIETLCNSTTSIIFLVFFLQLHIVKIRMESQMKHNSRELIERKIKKSRRIIACGAVMALTYNILYTVFFTLFEMTDIYEQVTWLESTQSICLIVILPYRIL